MAEKRGQPKNTVPHIKDVEGPIIGRFYMVDCAVLKQGDRVNYVPVIGPEHEDKELNAPYKHYHIDGRFSSLVIKDKASYWGDAVYKPGQTNLVVSTERENWFGIFERIETRKKKCLRLTTGLVVPNVQKKEVVKYWGWYKKMIGKKCKGEGVCPHRGVKMIEENGYFVCPLHKLYVSKETGRVVMPPEE